MAANTYLFAFFLVTHRWDEWVPESRALKMNEANLAKQASLKESYPGKKKAVPKTSGATESSDRGKKRAKDTSVDKEEEFTKRPEIKVPIPDSLKAQLVDDWENITKHQQVRLKDRMCLATSQFAHGRPENSSMGANIRLHVLLLATSSR